MPFAAAIAGGKTVHTLLSGPAAGAQAAARLAGEDAVRGLVSLDMGGTSADIAFIKEGRALEVTEGVIARRQLDVPALDMTSISAGGGSIASIDSGGFLAVGPESAGAEPGPACYGRGGTRPTVTDADVSCGFLNPEYFLGGAQKLDAKASHDAIQRDIGRPLKMSVLEAAAGIRRIVDIRMVDEIRVFAAKRGVDLTCFTLLPFGGAGAVHATAVAEELGMTRLLVPPNPGAFSALGLLCTDVVHDYIRSELGSLEELALAHADAIFVSLEARAREDLTSEKLNPADAVFTRELDLRYACFAASAFLTFNTSVLGARRHAMGRQCRQRRHQHHHQKGRDANGYLVSTIAGNREQPVVTMRYGGDADTKAHWRVYGKYLDRPSGNPLSGESMPGMEGRHGAEAFASIGTRMPQGTRLRCKVISITARPGNSARFPNLRRLTHCAGRRHFPRWRQSLRSLDARTGRAVQAYYDRASRNQITLPNSRDTFDTDAQYELPGIGRHKPTMGAGYRYTSDKLTPTSIIFAASTHLSENPEDKGCALLCTAYNLDRRALAAESVDKGLGDRKALPAG